MKLTVTADGTPSGTNVSDAVEAVQFYHKGGGLPRVRVDMLCVSGRMSGDGTFRVADPRSGELRMVRAIEFSDGERLELTPAGSAPGSDTSGQGDR
jgi:hypothetical protein